MKYFILKELVEYLTTHCHSIKLIKRVENNTILIDFINKKEFTQKSNKIYFNLTKGNSFIYKQESNTGATKDFNAPFDVQLLKRFTNSKINNISLYNDDKVINIEVLSKSSYKQQKTTIQLEFTGKHTNIVILDENRVILEALRHIDEYSSSRVVKVGIKLDEIIKPDFTPKMEKIDSIEDFLFDVYAKKEKNELDHLKKQKNTQLQKKITKLQKLIKSLANEEELEQESQNLYEKANLILSNIHNIKPYQADVTVINFEGIEVRIELDLKYPSPSVFANNLFTKAKKAKQKAKNLHMEKDNLEQKEQFLHRMISNISNLNSMDEIEFLMPKKQKNQKRTKKQEPYESFFFKGFKIMLGSDERANIYLLKNARASDFWFHLKDRPSSHVIVQNTKKTLPEDVIEKAAQICAKFSVDFGGNYLVDYTQRRNVKVQSGANVLYNPYNTTGINI